MADSTPASQKAIASPEEEEYEMEETWDYLCHRIVSDLHLHPDISEEKSDDVRQKMTEYLRRINECGLSEVDYASPYPELFGIIPVFPSSPLSPSTCEKQLLLVDICARKAVDRNNLWMGENLVFKGLVRVNLLLYRRGYYFITLKALPHESSEEATLYHTRVSCALDAEDPEDFTKANITVACFHPGSEPVYNSGIVSASPLESEETKTMSPKLEAEGFASFEEKVLQWMKEPGPPMSKEEKEAAFRWQQEYERENGWNAYGKMVGSGSGGLSFTPEVLESLPEDMRQKIIEYLDRINKCGLYDVDFDSPFVEDRAGLMLIFPYSPRTPFKYEAQLVVIHWCAKEAVKCHNLRTGAKLVFKRLVRVNLLFKGDYHYYMTLEALRDESSDLPKLYRTMVILDNDNLFVESFEPVPVTSDGSKGVEAAPK